MSSWKFYGDWQSLKVEAEKIKHREVERIIMEARSLGFELSPLAAKAILDSAEQATTALGSYISPDSILLQAAMLAAEQSAANDDGDRR